MDDRTCVSCSVIARCSECVDRNNCKKCKSPFKILSPKNCGCENKFFIDKENCTACPDECKTCTNTDHCTSCEDGYDVDDGVCRSDGLDTLVIVMIVVGVLAVAGAGKSCIM